jgi:hypothetical protein
MESDQKIAARDKVVSKACSWLDRRNAKPGLTGKAKDRAQSKFRESENELAEAAENFQKAK